MKTLTVISLLSLISFRREKTFIERPKEQNRYHNNANSASKFNYQQVKYSRGNSLFDYSNSTMVKKPRRKATVVQITKDETSDYNTDEESFSDEHQTCNTTLFHVENRQIRDCFEIQVTKRSINRKSKIHASEYKCKTFKPVSNGKYRKDRLELKSVRKFCSITVFSIDTTCCIKSIYLSINLCLSIYFLISHLFIN